MKYSFIIPVYNGEKYIDRCLTSLLNQTYKIYEIIIIDDGSTDNSKQILKEYQNKYPKQIKLFTQKNKGVSVARNKGLKEAKSDYILFVDIDDYISNQTLEVLEKYSDLKYDLIKFDWTNHQNKLNSKETTEEEYTGSNAIKHLIIKQRVFEMPVLYAYKKEYLNKIKFKFKEGCYHEDFGAIPITILKTNNILITNNILYYYDQKVEGSITDDDDYQKTYKKAYDVLNLYKDLKEELNQLKTIDEEAIYLLKSYNANAVLDKRKTLNKKDRKRYSLEILKNKVINDLYARTFQTKLKKLFYKICYSIINFINL